MNQKDSEANYYKQIDATNDIVDVTGGRNSVNSDISDANGDTINAINDIKFDLLLKFKCRQVFVLCEFLIDDVECD